MTKLSRPEIRALIQGDHKDAETWFREQIPALNSDQDQGLKRIAKNNILRMLDLLRHSHEQDHARALEFAKYAINNIKTADLEICTSAILCAQKVKDKESILAFANLAIDKFEDHAGFHSDKIKALIHLDRREEALQHAEYAKEFVGEDDKFKINYARALIAATSMVQNGQLTAALTILQPLIVKEMYNPTKQLMELAALELACMDDDALIAETLDTRGMLVRKFRKSRTPEKDTDAIARIVFAVMHPERVDRMKAAFGIREVFADQIYDSLGL